jgi:ABC-type nickel/cobalt efflux system permease component RcnA
VLSFVAILTLGFFLGMRHATDPDHVIAVTTIVSKQSGLARAGLIGALWGLGHTFTIFLVGAATILFRVSIPVRLGLSMELAVGLMLILLGTLNLTGLLRSLQEKFMPQNPRASQVHSQDTQGELSLICYVPGCEAPRRGLWSHGWLTKNLLGMGAYNILRPLVVGTVHGLAGSAAIALLVMTTIRDPWWAIGYLFIFGLGTIAGMMLITTLIAAPFVLGTGKFSGWDRAMSIGSGLLSVCFGLFVSYRMGFVEGLFTAHPRWTPH